MSATDTSLEKPPAPSGVAAPDPFVLGGRTFRSRLIIGTGKYSTPEVMKEAHRESGAEIVTVAVRRINLDPAHLAAISDDDRRAGSVRGDDLRQVFHQVIAHEARMPARAARRDHDLVERLQLFAQS